MNHSWNKYRKKRKRKKKKEMNKTNKIKTKNKNKIRAQCELTWLETHSFYTSEFWKVLFTLLIGNTREITRNIGESLIYLQRGADSFLLQFYFQFSILGPLLFIIYVNSLPDCINCKCVMYTDDTTLLFKSADSTSLQFHMNDCMSKYQQTYS